MAVLPRTESGHEGKVELVPLNSLNFQQRTQILDMALKTKDMDNELFLRKVRTRLDRCSSPSFPVSQTGCLQPPRLGTYIRSTLVHCRVGIELPSVEVRFEGLEVDAQAYAAGRELPSIFNAYRNWVEVCSPFCYPRALDSWEDLCSIRAPVCDCAPAKKLMSILL